MGGTKEASNILWFTTTCGGQHPPLLLDIGRHGLLTVASSTQVWGSGYTGMH